MTAFHHFARTLLVGAFFGGFVACGNDGRPPGADGDPSHGKTPIEGECLVPSAGCPCTKEAAIYECGVLIDREGDTVTCRRGERTCLDGAWSECLGERTTQIYGPAPPPAGVRVQGLATAPTDCNDPCEPLCALLADDPEDLVVGDDFAVDGDDLVLDTEGFSASNCPDVQITPETATVEVTGLATVNDALVVTHDPLQFQTTCGPTTPIFPSYEVDQTDRAMVELDGELRLFSGVAGELLVTANSANDSDSSTVTVQVNIEEADAGVTAAIQTELDAAGVGVDLATTLYPYRNTVFPLDLKAPLVQWRTNGSAADHVEVALRYPAGSATPLFWYSRVVVGDPMQGTVQTTGAPAFSLPQEVWTAFSRTAAGAVGEIVVQRRVAGTVREPMVIPVRFATAPLRGTVYYTQYNRRLFVAGAATVESGQADLPETYDPLNPSGTICPVGYNTHMTGSTTRAIDMSTPTATNLDPFNGTGGCPVCHSVSAQGNVFVAGSRFLQVYDGGTATAFVNDITVSGAGAVFAARGEGMAPNYSSMRYATDWGSRGFAFSALTPDGALATQGPYFWGNTAPYGGDNMTIDRTSTAGGQIQPNFFVPTAVPGANVQYATTTALAATRPMGSNVLTANSGGAIPQIDGANLWVGAAVLVKDQADARDNGIYVVNNLGTASAMSGELTPTGSSASSVTGGNTAASAFDNNGGSRWESVHGAGTQTLTADFGSNQTINRVQIVWENASAATYSLQYSTNGTTWTTFVNSPTYTLGARTDDYLTNSANWTPANTSISARYIRINCFTRVATNSWGYSIYELNVFGVTAGTPWVMTRRSDAQTPASATDGTIKANWEVRVTRGNANYAKVFRLTSPTTDPNINVDNLTFTDINASPLPVMTMPSISPDGTKMVYVTGDADPIGTDTTAWRKGLSMVSLDQATRTISNKTRLVNNWTGAAPGGIPIKWPFFEPDSRSVVYVQTSTDEWCGSGNDSGSDKGRACFGDGPAFANTAPTQRGYFPGRLYSVDSSSPATTKTELANLNVAEEALDANKAFQPTVLPFSVGGYRWVIFTSPRAYGNQINQNTATQSTYFSCAATLLWIAALDDETAGTTDRSHPAFLLPGQNIKKITEYIHYMNERGYLVPTPCKSSGLACTTDDECCGGTTCQVDSFSATGEPMRVCKDPMACSQEGEACLTDADCCGGSPCNAQQCQPLPSYEEATYTRTYEAECPTGFKPLWTNFSYHLTTPTDSSISFSAQAAATEDELDDAELVFLEESTADNDGDDAESVDVGEALIDAEVVPVYPFLRISMTFHPSGNGALSPALHDWEQRFVCVPSE